MKKSSLVILFALAAGSAHAQTVGPLATYLVDPCRFVDTRDDVLAPFEHAGPFVDGELRRYHVGAHCGVPSDAKGVILNVTVTEATAVGHVVVYGPAPNVPAPVVSTLNLTPSITMANEVTVRLGADAIGGPGALLFVDLAVRVVVPGGTVHVVLDVTGYLK